MPIRCIRGAITAENTKESIWQNTEEMLTEIINSNKIEIEDIISITFTCTRELDAAYPAVAARKMGIVSAALMCMPELYVRGSLQYCIRAMMQIESDKEQREMQHVYLKGAEVLRPDIVNQKYRGMKIAIDGPGGSGKSTVAKLVAAELGLTYIDSGAMYRAVGLQAMRHGVDYNKEDAVCALLPGIEISFSRRDGEQRVMLGGEDVTEAIRTAEGGVAASAVARYKRVREHLVIIQRQLADEGVVMDGRDIGTCVLPDADLKVYLDADVKSRVSRRCHELDELGEQHNAEQIASEIAARDHQDMTREHSPLTRAGDAAYLDSSRMSIDEAKAAILNMIKNIRR